MPSLQSFVRLLAVVLSLSFPVGVKADDVQDINQLFRKGDLSGALSRANQFLAKNPKDAQVRFLKGLILADQGKSAEATQVFTAITEDYPELPEPYNNLAVLYAAEGKYDAAKNALEMAIRTHPSYATAHENLGDLYAKMASQAYDKALQIDNSNKTAQTKLALIKDMMSGKPPRPAVTVPASNKPETVIVQAASPIPPVAKPAPSIEPNPSIPEAAKSPARNKQETVIVQAASPIPPVAKPAAAIVDPKPSMPEAAKSPASIIETVQSWAKAWSNKDVDKYLSHYSPDFSPANMSHSEWAAQRHARIAGAKRIVVIPRNIQVKRISPNRAEVHFNQVYQSDRLKNTSGKTLELGLINGKWLIVRESMR